MSGGRFRLGRNKKAKMRPEVNLTEDCHMTELLHMKDNYIREFDATITKVGQNYVVLDRTAFYPESGGQSGDRGVLKSGRTEAVVTGTKKKGEVRHYLSGPPPFETGMEVHGELDWAFRHECMRYHTAQHVLSRYLQLNHGLETQGNMVKPTESRADYAPIDDFSDELVAETEAAVNEILAKNLDVRIEFMPRKEAIEYLKKRKYQTRYLEMVPESVKNFRVVLIGDYDASACAGTHVGNTGEIGALRINKTKNVGAEKQRLYFSLTAP
ncbi:alanyl-tRNA editing protein [Candidatus Thorarchaeota archaeon]|nr:MAG: alanyl-tRNA editing protein [Candidatus Thorarchaeota archaeon]